MKSKIDYFPVIFEKHCCLPITNFLLFFFKFFQLSFSLWQFSSASQNLHDIFIEIPMAQRMDIIAKDREWQQFKLNKSKSFDGNRSNRRW